MSRPDITLISPFPASGAVHAGYSGVASYTANLAAALADQGASVAVVAEVLDDASSRRRAAPPECHGPIRIHRAFRRGPAALLDATRAARRLGAPIAHLQLELFLYGGPLALGSMPLALRRLAGAGQGPVVTLHQVLDARRIDRDTTTLHRVSVPPAVARAGIGGLQHLVGRLAAATVVHEAPFADLVPDAVVIPHGIEAVERPGRTEARHQLEVDDDRLTVLAFGFMAPYKGLELLLDAGALAADDVEIVVAGGEHPRLAGRDPYADELRDRHAHHARFTGWVPEAHVGPWFAAADLAAYPYPKPFSASGSLALALAHRTPVLLSPALARFAGAPSDLAMPTDPGDLAAQLRDLAAHRAHLSELSAWTQTLAEGRSWSAVATHHLALYQEVIDARDPARRRVRSGQPR